MWALAEVIGESGVAETYSILCTFRSSPSDARQLERLEENKSTDLYLNDPFHHSKVRMYHRALIW